MAQLSMSTSRNKAVYHFQALYLDPRAMELGCLSPKGSLSWLHFVTASVLYSCFELCMQQIYPCVNHIKSYKLGQCSIVSDMYYCFNSLHCGSSFCRIISSDTPRAIWKLLPGHISQSLFNSHYFLWIFIVIER